jgi:hypothetical protein
LSQPLGTILMHLVPTQGLRHQTMQASAYSSLRAAPTPRAVR